MTLARNSFCRAVDEKTALRLIELQHAAELFKLFEANRTYLRRWHPWVDHFDSPDAVARAIASWLELYEKKLACHAGIWFDGQFCGGVSYLNVDGVNRWTPLCYWLDAQHQGRGIMTACCRAMIAHGFAEWGFNRLTIECAAGNARSRAVAERLGFKFEGIIRGIQWLHDHFVDAAVYGLLRSDYESSPELNGAPLLESAQDSGLLESIPATQDCSNRLSPWTARLCREG